MDYHHFDGIFIGYTAIDQNIRYIDINSGLVKHSHNAVFNEAWYLQPSRPPVAQLLYDLGLQQDDEPVASTPLPDSPHSTTPPPPKRGVSVRADKAFHN
jgi:hypothetical protein